MLAHVSTIRSEISSGCFILAVLLLIPIPFVVFRSLETIKGNPVIELNITIIAAALLCFLTTVPPFLISTSFELPSPSTTRASQCTICEFYRVTVRAVAM